MRFKTGIAVSLTCFALLTVLLVGCGGGQQTPPPQPTKGPGPFPPRSINGQVSYTGSVKPGHQIIVVATRTGEQSPAYSAIIKQPGTYQISNISDATYKIFVFIDLGDDMGPPQANEPSGYYDPNGDGTADDVIIKDGKPVSGVDITLRDPK